MCGSGLPSLLNRAVMFLEQPRTNLGTFDSVLERGGLQGHVFIEMYVFLFKMNYFLLAVLRQPLDSIFISMILSTQGTYVK